MKTLKNYFLLFVGCWFLFFACAEDSDNRPLPTQDGSVDSNLAIVCGNGEVEEGEECDDNNLLDGDGCSPVCTIEDGWTCDGSPSICVNLCGNGTIDHGEQCDGNQLGGNDCTTIPGGYTGGSLKCTASCLFDTTECVLPNCGNGVLDPGEDCDDGENNSTTGACLPNCRETSCGDGYVWEGTEECDDGNTSNNDACLNNCTQASCGDGYIRQGEEECDNGALNSNTQPDACRMDCSLPSCGDGIEDSGEECDDGNQMEGDGCSPNCNNESLPLLYSVSSLPGGWTVTPVTYAGKPHAPSLPIVAAANIETRGEAFVFTAQNYHLLDTTNLQWAEHGTVSSKFSGATGTNLTSGYGISWSNEEATSITLVEGEWSRSYSVDNNTLEVTPDPNNPQHIDWSETGGYPPNPIYVKAVWLALENDEGWVTGDPSQICETQATTIGPYAAALTTGGSLHLYEAGYCWEFYKMMPLGDFPPFGLSDAPPSSDIAAAFYVSPSLYIFTNP